MNLVFATNNKNKLAEISQILPEEISLQGLADIGFNGEIPEDHDTLDENALQKALFIHERYNCNCFSDDTGLEIEALDGRPGVYSARYAGPDCVAADNVKKVLQEMAGKANRKACFRTVIALILEGRQYIFEGRVEGEILTEPRGDGGFGYDPVFKPEGSELSFAEMSLTEKNKLSHRAKAVDQLLRFLGGGNIIL